MTDQERILVLEQTLRGLHQAMPYDTIGRAIIEHALKGERRIPLPPQFEPSGYVATNLLAFLNAFPEAHNGDWYHQLLGWCDVTLKETPHTSNMSSDEIRRMVTGK